MISSRPLLSRPLAALACGVLIATLSAPASAQWKWRDKNGQVTLSNLPPPRDVPPQDILQQPGPTTAARPAPATAAASAPGEGAGKPAVDRELQARKRAADQEQAARAKSDADRLDAKRAENCRVARSQLAALDSGQRIARYTDKGERENLDDEQRAAETRRVRAIITSDCR